ncbi:MAG: hypothetical protein WC344_03450 [Bacilli bacterium]|jgi:L-fucose isomerase-like protein
MNKINVIALRSPLSENHEILNQERGAFLDSLSHLLNVEFAFGEITPISVFLIETGGTEEEFIKCYQNYRPPYYLLTTKRRNSLPAALEIGAYLSNRNLPYKIMHGTGAIIAQELRRIILSFQDKEMPSFRFGVIGKPSDWLIASDVDRFYAEQKYHILFIDVDYEEFLAEINQKTYESSDVTAKIRQKAANNKYLDGALHIYGALKRLVKKHDLHGFSIRCFDLLGSYHNTACLALALINSEGINAGCEGDLPILVGMHLIRQCLAQASFQANPSSIDLEAKTITFAHCTVPFSMCPKSEFLTHFESGLGIGIRGQMKTGPCTVFRLSANLRKAFIAEGEIVANLSRDDLCRTQIVIKIDNGLDKLLSSPLGNHHLIIYGHHSKALLATLTSLDANLKLI